MGKHHSKSNDKPKEQIPSSIAIYWRLLREFAGRYWGYLFIGILAGLLMGGALRAHLSFLDMGVSTLGNEGKSGKPDAVVQRIVEFPPVRWVMEKLDLKYQPDDTHRENKDKNPRPEIKDDKGGQLEKMAGRLGLDTEGVLSFRMVCFIIVMLVLFCIAKSFFELVNKFSLQWVGSRVVADIRERLFETFERQSLHFYSQHDVGQLISRCTNDAATVQHSFANCISELFLAPVQLIVSVWYCVEKARSANMGTPILIVILLVPVVIIPVYVISKYLRHYQHKVLSRISELTGRMQETMSGITVVKAFHQEQRELDRFSKQNNRYFKAVVKTIVLDVFMQPTMQLSAISLGAIFLLICYQQHVPLLTIGVIGYAATQAYKPIKEIAKFNVNLQKCAAALDRIFHALDTNDCLPEAENPVPIADFKNEIVFQDVTFSYNEGAPVVMQGFNLTIPKGSHVALVGATGSGKSTIASLLARFYDPVKGSVSIDGVDLRNISNHDLRKLVGIVSQENFLFNSDIAFNLCYGRPEATQEEMEDAARRANATEFIEANPEGFARAVGERGNQLSGGQKQRVAIARALLVNPPILILDEATSALDTVTEQQVQLAITELMKERTVLSIAHRLSTILTADKIVVIDNGRIVEQGTHAELYAKNGIYADLYNRQIAKSTEAQTHE